MKYFRTKVREKEVNLYPIVCWHIGARQSSIKFIQEIIERIQGDPLAKVIYMGDAGECVTKSSKGNIYEQTMSPQQQLDTAAELLSPIREKILFGIRGNHGNRIDKESGLSWDSALCARVGIPYLGISALMDMSFQLTSTATKSVSVYVHHGAAGAISPGGKMAAGHRPEQLVMADIALTAHTHACGECWPDRLLAYVDSTNRRIRYQKMKMFVCGSGYDSRSGYAEEKQYPVITPAHLVINVRAGRTADGAASVEVAHTTIDGSSDKYAPRDVKDGWTE